MKILTNLSKLTQTVLAFCLLSSTVMAQEYWFDNAGADNSWDTVGNWANVKDLSGRATEVPTGSIADKLVIINADANYTTGTLVLDNSTQTKINRVFAVGREKSGSTATFNVSGGSISVTQPQAFYIGTPYWIWSVKDDGANGWTVGNTAGHLNLTGGTITFTGADTYIGRNGSSLTINGGDMTIEKLYFQETNTVATMSSGSLTITTGNISGLGTVNFTAGSTASLTLTGKTFADVETLTDAGLITFDGLKITDHESVFDFSNETVTLSTMPLVLRPSPTTMTAIWSDSANEAASRYTVELDTVATFDSGSQVVVTDLATQSYNFTGLNSETVYYVRVKETAVSAGAGAYHTSSAATLSTVIGKWKFEETTGTTVADSSAQGNGLTATAGVDLNVTGVATTSGADISTGQLTTASLKVSSNDGTNDSFSVSAFVKVDSLGAEQAVICQDDVFVLRVRPSGHIGLTTPGKADYPLSTGAITAGEWSHVALTMTTDQSTTATVNYYINGQPAGTVTAAVKGLSTITNPIRVGQSQWGNQFVGDIDEVQVYRVALTDQEILEIYNQNTTETPFSYSNDFETEDLSGWTLTAGPDGVPYIGGGYVDSGNKVLLGKNGAKAATNSGTLGYTIEVGKAIQVTFDTPKQAIHGPDVNYKIDVRSFYWDGDNNEVDIHTYNYGGDKVASVNYQFNLPVAAVGQQLGIEFTFIGGWEPEVDNLLIEVVDGPKDFYYDDTASGTSDWSAAGNWWMNFDATIQAASAIPAVVDNSQYVGVKKSVTLTSDTAISGTDAFVVANAHLTIASGNTLSVTGDSWIGLNYWSETAGWPSGWKGGQLTVAGGTATFDNLNLYSSGSHIYVNSGELNVTGTYSTSRDGNNFTPTINLTAGNVNIGTWNSDNTANNARINFTAGDAGVVKITGYTATEYAQFITDGILLIDGVASTNLSTDFDVDNATGEIALKGVLTPAIGIELIQTGTELTWYVEEEIGVKEYRIVDVDGNELANPVQAGGSGSYTVILDSAAEARLIVVDNSGYTQTYVPADGNIVKVAYNLNQGWNLIAMPGANADISALENATVGRIWSWNGVAYESVEIPTAGNAVWVYAPATAQVIISAEKVATELSLNPGWNMVGPTVNTEIPADAHSVYSWNDTYQKVVDEDNVLLQGVGYWIFSL